MPPRVSRDLINRLRNGYQHPYTASFLAEILRETEWMRIEDSPVIEKLPCSGTVNARSAQTLRPAICATEAHLTGLIVTRGHLCPCAAWQQFRSVWYDTKLVPERFQDVRLETLQPVAFPTSLMSLKRQAEIIEQLKADPTGSYLFCGDAGTGKTHFSFALLRHAVLEWARVASKKDCPVRSIFRVNAKQILDEHHAWITRKEDDHVKAPSITPLQLRNLVRDGYKVSLFIDEIDKFGPTKFRIDSLLELTDVVYEGKGQIVATSNASRDRLKELWSGFDSAEAILRRISGREANGWYVTFPKQK
jgi:ATPase family associated with various cellular activities (AAA)